METPQEMLDRVRLMGRLDTDWDLSDNDTAAIRYVLGEAAKYREVAAERDQLRAEVERLREIGPRCEVGHHELMSCGRGHEVALYRLKDGCFACKLTARAEAAENTVIRLTLKAESAELERDEAIQLLVGTQRDVVTLRGMVESNAAALDEASQLIRAVASILNPHDPYDPAKLLGWARDTVDRAREADVALANAQELKNKLNCL